MKCQSNLPLSAILVIVPQLSEFDVSLEKDLGTRNYEADNEPVHYLHCRWERPMLKHPVRKCRCASGDHGHKPGKCNNLATEHDQLCKPCSDRQAKELRLIGVASGREAKRPSR